MPQTTKQKNASRSTRSRFHRRKNRSECRRTGSERAKQEDPRVIANSVFALTLQQKPGIEVFDKTEINCSYGEQDDYYAMYRDLLAAYQKAMKLLGNETKADPLKDGLSIATCLMYVINGFRNNVLIAGYELRIDKNYDHYYFTMYLSCDFPDWWHAFEIMPVVEYLKRKSPKLHDLFLSFISYMKTRLDISTWYNGGCGYAEYYVDEAIEIDIWQDNHGPIYAEPDATKEEKRDAKEPRQKYEQLLDDFNNYNAGVIHEYELFLRHIGPDVRYIKSHLSCFDKKIAIVAWMKEMLEFMKEPGSVSDYHFSELIDGEEYEGITFDRQVTIIWDWHDGYTALEMDSIDADATSLGTLPPIFHYRVSKHTKQMNLDKYHDWQTWPMRFSKLWEKYRDIANDCRRKLKLKV
ncbi:MAG: hypothetical protein ACJ749_11075 [Flavisolibacter sp.]|jgi:hypothetical protein